MVGGVVIEVSEIKSMPWALFVDCHETAYRDTCAVLIEKNTVSLQISIGDSVWWQNGKVMWTPSANIGKPNNKQGIDFDILITKIGYSGAKHPDRDLLSYD